jgi:MYXO-CTERM domain-containing protein
VLICQGGQGPQAEVCDGKDNDCDSLVDEAPLADGPGPGLNGCWDLPGTCCKFPLINPDITWCPPPGANCGDDGNLTSPCNNGTLACAGAAGWVCQNAKKPSAEACDGLDNDCNGKVDDGTIPQVGQACGSDKGECKLGVITCTAGVLDCVGDVPPSPEVCDGKDNDCDGTVDNGIASSGACTPDYDKVAYPGDRSAPPCQKGILQCNLGVSECIGGVGPSPEVCDGIDNDCDGLVDEVGTAPDGIDGTANPFPPPNVSIGDPCGIDVGECKAGKYGCVNGTVACLGGQGQTVEQCDCLDNDCDGTIDNTNPGNSPPLCGPGKDCVKSGSQCQCASACDPTSEFPCPSGQTCLPADGATGTKNYCVADPCVDCANATVKDASDKVICAPAGTVLPNCATAPVCVCKGQNGCQDPCLNVTCPQGQACSSYGPNAGKCAVDNCFANPCQGCDKVCNLGSCVVNPCSDPNACPGQECKPSGDFKTAVCVDSCATVTCPSGQACVDGACVATCDPGCLIGQACDLSQSPPVCVANKCQPNPCTDGSYCNPATGTCGNEPCSGVRCPDGQECSLGQCKLVQTSTSSTTSTGSMSDATSTSTSSASSGTGGAGAGGSGSNGVWGLATGGGGCSCEVGSKSSDLAGARLGLIALALALGRLRKRNKQERSIEAEVRR